MTEADIANISWLLQELQRIGGSKITDKKLKKGIKK
jgi:hypothetical protein